MREGDFLNKNIDKKRELVMYGVILTLLTFFVVCNNMFWKFGENAEQKNEQNETQYLKSNNITYNVPYQDKVMEY